LKSANFDGFRRDILSGDKMEKTIHLVYERDTKRTYPFQEESDDPVVVTLYVKKGAFRQRPKAIEITLRAED